MYINIIPIHFIKTQTHNIINDNFFVLKPSSAVYIWPDLALFPAGDNQAHCMHDCGNIWLTGPV